MLRRGLPLAALALLVACKPAAFATQEANLMREPPPLLPTDVNSYWNDRGRGIYGEFSVGPGLYRRGDATCRSARVTSIDAAGSQDRTLLYCTRGGGPFQLDPALSCRLAGAGPALACRDAGGDTVLLSPA